MLLYDILPTSNEIMIALSQETCNITSQRNPSCFNNGISTFLPWCLPQRCEVATFSAVGPSNNRMPLGKTGVLTSSNDSDVSEEGSGCWIWT